MSIEIQNKLGELKEKGWTLANVAREIGQAKVTVETWNQGTRLRLMRNRCCTLDRLGARKRTPPQKYFVKKLKGK